MRTVIVDTGPLLAFLDRSDRHSAWCKSVFSRFSAPFVTCEPVITETSFLLGRAKLDYTLPLQLIEQNLLVIDFSLSKEMARLRELMLQYRNVPMSLADACLVRMAEYSDDNLIITLDSDFLVYRIHGNKPISVLIPE